MGRSLNRKHPGTPRISPIRGGRSLTPRFYRSIPKIGSKINRRVHIHMLHTGGFILKVYKWFYDGTGGLSNPWNDSETWNE